MMQAMGYRILSPCRYIVQCLLGALLLFGSCHAPADARYPLEPVDTSSPRATLTSYITEMEGVWRVFRDEYWDAPTYEIYQDIMSRAGRILRTLDLSEVAPSARIEVGHQAATLLYETLARIELPPMEAIPDAAAFEDTEGPRVGRYRTPISPSPG
jgi:MscS family membrane protein